MHPISTPKSRSRRHARFLATAPLLAIVLTTLVPVLPANAAGNMVKNPSFEAWGASAPTDWSTWTPAGTATYTKVTGRDGSGAAQIATSTQGSRGFLVQDVAIPAGSESIDLSFWQKKGTVTGTGKAGVRVTFTGGTAQFFGLDAAPDWRKVATTLPVPAGVTNVRIEPMLDYMQGTMSLDDVDVQVDGPFTNLAVNAGFEAFTLANPDSWGRWLAAGTGTVAKAAGMENLNAASITTDTTASRLALTQDITLPAGGGTYVVDFASKIDTISGTGKAGIRVDVLDGSKGTAFYGRNTPTAGWERTRGAIVVPADATRIRVHAFNDGVKATALYDDIQVTKSTGDMELSTSLTASNDISVAWTKPTATNIATYDLHRAEGAAPTGTAADRVRTLPSTLLKASDQEWLPGKTYNYLVIGRDAAGAEVVRSSVGQATAPATDTTATSVLSIAANGTTDHIGWRAAASATLPLKVVGSTSAITPANAASATVLVSGLGRLGGLDQAGAAYVGLVDASGTLIATASRQDLPHPRIGLNTDVLAKINRLIANPGTPQDAWNTVKARVDAGSATYGYSIDRYAREAAFVYQVTQDPSYATIAYDAFVQSAAATPFEAEQELNTANPVSSLALVYDWASPAWTAAQKAYAHDYFERTAVFFEHVKHPNVVGTDKASNWVGVIRGAELAQHLALRGEGTYGWRDARIARISDQLRQHLDAAHTDGGWFQEGLDYLDYTNMISVPGITGCDRFIWPRQDGYFRPHFMTRRAPVTVICGPTFNVGSISGWMRRKAGLDGVESGVVRADSEGRPG
ncbi:hypothetical protein V1639_08410 [Pseudarthrobacter sp. J75]|uniref:hypothetical protein n=1 Tax=Pseudarthrobacter sp. J75 TaxID=3116486 RepID=UPI002E814507|nr:hypothetical protein [Pseudarthrobacter sp. J75]MEE2529051.1 hypothetical protein [Pseudarthrobacter sp. J75]